MIPLTECPLSEGFGFAPLASQRRRPRTRVPIARRLAVALMKLSCDVTKINSHFQPPPVQVKKGETFFVALVAVDQVGHTVPANIITSLSSPNAGFGEGEQVQMVGEGCTFLKYIQCHKVHRLTILKLFLSLLTVHVVVLLYRLDTYLLTI